MRRFPRLTSPENWHASDWVECAEGFSSIIDGYWWAPLKAPITRDLLFCAARHQAFAFRKYQDFFASPLFLDLENHIVGDLSDGVLFTGEAGHYHYLIDGLACLSEELFFERHRLFVDDDLTEDQLGFLEFVLETLFDKRVDVVRVPRGLYTLRNVSVPFIGPWERKANRLRNHIRRLPLERLANSPKRVLVGRRLAKRRRFLNEDEVFQSVLQPCGYERVDCEVLSLREQASLFSGAVEVVGAHGAGLANIAFSEKPKLLLELWHSVRQPFFSSLAFALECGYAEVQGCPRNSVASDGRPDNEDFVVDVRVLQERLDFLE